MSADLMARIREELDPSVGKYPGRNNFEGTHTERVCRLQKAPSVAEIIEHPATLALIDKLLQEFSSPPRFQYRAPR